MSIVDSALRKKTEDKLSADISLNPISRYDNRNIITRLFSLRIRELR